MKNTKKTLWIKSAAIMLAISAIFLLDAYAGKGPGGGGGGEGRDIYGSEVTVEDCLLCHSDVDGNYHHAAVELCTKPCGEDGQDEECWECWDCLDCHEVVDEVVDEASVNVVFDADSDCLKCHDISEVEGPGISNVHHGTGLDCVVCHGF
ncbi:MAG: hypothetical protein AVO38_13475 [delta proteobacterium ML8_D]|jgi:hypothetical protein|nr:MAG: hypothetical protein AVO38_13475 [delta proteobacterium ML8_D]